MHYAYFFHLPLTTAKNSNQRNCIATEMPYLTFKLRKSNVVPNIWVPVKRHKTSFYDGSAILLILADNHVTIPLLEGEETNGKRTDY